MEFLSEQRLRRHGQRILAAANGKAYSPRTRTEPYNSRTEESIEISD